MLDAGFQILNFKKAALNSNNKKAMRIKHAWPF
jgi:hypothetical protein